MVFFSQSPEQSKILETAGIGHVDISEFDCDRLIYDGRTKIGQLPTNLIQSLDNSVLIDNVENFEPKFGKSVFQAFIFLVLILKKFR